MPTSEAVLARLCNRCNAVLTDSVAAGACVCGCPEFRIEEAPMPTLTDEEFTLADEDDDPSPGQTTDDADGTDRKRPSAPIRDIRGSQLPNRKETDMATATKPKRTRKTKPQPTPVPETQEQAAAKEALNGEVEILEWIDVELSKVQPHPHNPRTDLGDLKGLAASLKRQQLQEIVIRAAGRGRYQLIAGNRRLRAAKVAKLKTLRATVIACSDAVALELLGRENVERQDFNALEEARWLASLLETTGMSQRQLSAHLQATMQKSSAGGGAEMSQGHIANRLRLLKLPTWWQKQLISGALTPAHLRELATWADRPAVLKAMEKRAKNPGSIESWKDDVNRAIADLTLPAEPGAYDRLQRGKKSEYAKVLLTKKDIEQHAEALDLVDVAMRWGRKEKRAFNADLWWQLQDERAAAEKKRAQKSRRSENGKVEASGASPAEKAKRQAEILGRRLFAWKVRHLQSQLADRLHNVDDTDTLHRLMLWWMALDDRGAVLHKLLHGGGLPSATVLLTSLQKLKGEQLLETAREAMAAWITEEGVDRYMPLTPAAVLALAEMMEVDLATSFKADEEFLGLFTKDQLWELAKEWKQTPNSWEGASKSVLIQRLGAWAEQRNPPPPKALVKAKR
jgi:ParB/RepB/Spo0J family partition protein